MGGAARRGRHHRGEHVHRHLGAVGLSSVATVENGDDGDHRYTELYREIAGPRLKGEYILVADKALAFRIEVDKASRREAVRDGFFDILETVSAPRKWNAAEESHERAEYRGFACFFKKGEVSAARENGEAMGERVERHAVVADQNGARREPMSRHRIYFFDFNIVHGAAEWPAEKPD